MPERVRPFWVEADISGRNTTLAGGPASAHGDMTVRVKIRSHGRVVDAVRVEAFNDGRGELELHVIPAAAQEIEPLPHGGFKIKSRY